MDKKLIRKRRALGFTQHTLSDASGVPRHRIAFAETGRLSLTKDELEKIQAAIRKRAERVAALVAA